VKKTKATVKKRVAKAKVAEKRKKAVLARKRKPKASKAKKAKKVKKAKLTTTTVVSFANDIRPMYTATDIAHMQFFCDLSKRDDNQLHAQEILKRLKGQGGRVMPPPPAQPWTKQQIALYQSWIDGGFKP
jgi:hypothetical protein